MPKYKVGDVLKPSKREEGAEFILRVIAICGEIIATEALGEIRWWTEKK